MPKPAVKTPSLGDAVQGHLPKPRPAKAGPVWAGPGGAGSQGGITQSMLGRYLGCKERFRLMVVEGLKPKPKFSAAMDFGNMWHACEEAHAAGKPFDRPLEAHVRALMARFPLQQTEIAEWWAKCSVLFQVYADHWAMHPDMIHRKPLMQEQLFDVPYTLPSGRVVRLRGKMDSVDVVQEMKGKFRVGERAAWLQENKSKSGIDAAKITRQLNFDLQTMLYLVALDEMKQWVVEVRNPLDDLSKLPIKGVRYNVVKRSTHKTPESMLKKIDDDRKAGRIGEWFLRLNVEVSQADMERFKRECLDPVLENLLDDWEWWAVCKNGDQDVFDMDLQMAYRHSREQASSQIPRHFRYPFGIYNPLSEGAEAELDAFIATGDERGLIRTDDLFPELKV